MDKLWAILRPLIAKALTLLRAGAAKLVPYGMLKPIGYSFIAGCVVAVVLTSWAGQGTVLRAYQRGHSDGYDKGLATCGQSNPEPYRKKWKWFDKLFTPELTAPAVIVEHEQYDGEPELMEAPR